MLSAAFEGAKQVAKLAQEVGKMELHQKAVELMAQVMELSEQNLDLTKRNLELENAIQKMKEQANIKLVFRTGFYWMEDEQGPFCSCCYDVEKLLVRVVGHAPNRFCPNCSIKKRK